MSKSEILGKSSLNKAISSYAADRKLVLTLLVSSLAYKLSLAARSKSGS